MTAIRRIDLPHLFLTADAILITLDNVASGLVVYPARVHSRLMEELPFMVSLIFILICCFLLWELRAQELFREPAFVLGAWLLSS